ncbi:zinc finger C2H2-type/integrase DNA-binding domain-containing protein [Tanacetum coccineum]
MSKLPKVKSSRSRSPSPDRSGKAVGKGKDSTVGFSNKDKGGQTRSFSKEMKQSCWEMAETVPGQDPDRWRRDAVGNIVFKGFTKCHGPLCYEFDHVKPYVKGFSNGKQLGGHMRSHSALIAASRKKGVHGVNQFVFGDHMINKHGVHGFAFGHAKMANNSQLFYQDCDQGFVNGEKGLGFAYDCDRIVKKSQHFDQGYDQDYGANGRIKGQDFVNGGKVYGDFDDGGGYEMVKKSQQKMEADQDYDQDDGANNAYECGEEFSSSKALVNHKRSHPRKESNKDTICEKCGRGFDSLKTLYGHMRCHSAKRSHAFDAYDEHDGNVDGGVANPIRKKRSYTRYTSPKHDNVGTSLSFSSCSDDYEVAAICLIMISRGVRSLDELKLVFSRQPDFAFSDYEYSGTSENNAEFEVSVDESMGYGSFVNESKLGLKKDLNVGYGSGQLEMNLVRPAMVNCKSSKIPRSCDQDFRDRDGTGSGILLEPKKRYKDHVCAICYKKFGSAQALGSHKRVHNKDENKSSGVNSSDVEFKLTWVHSEIEWDPFAVCSSECYISKSILLTEQQLDGIEIGYYGNVKRDKFMSALPGDPFA